MTDQRSGKPCATCGREHIAGVWWPRHPYRAAVVAEAAAGKTKCAYADHGSSARLRTVACVGPVIFTIHDRRGCLPVCFAHADWRMSQSMMPGHSLGCAGFPERPL